VVRVRFRVRVRVRFRVRVRPAGELLRQRRDVFLDRPKRNVMKWDEK